MFKLFRKKSRPGPEPAAAKPTSASPTVVSSKLQKKPQQELTNFASTYDNKQLFMKEEQRYRAIKQKLARQAVACQIFGKFFGNRPDYPVKVPDSMLKDLRQKLLTSDETLFIPIIKYLSSPNYWSGAQVLKWLEEVGLGEFQDRFDMHAITGSELFDLQQNDLENDIGMNVVAAKKFIREREKLKAMC
eukprot:TRINITY_DN680_c0_g2_i1.p1 TRINITY_DN680_c0_g2~~TRINITY_DN680_c0_g2_i1.p1  ORF type:complete len:189 (-),score=41.72 TRINITY_DN680_c0_g2_i1:102-668(-)